MEDWREYEDDEERTPSGPGCMFCLQVWGALRWYFPCSLDRRRSMLMGYRPSMGYREGKFLRETKRRRRFIPRRSLRLRCLNEWMMDGGVMRMLCMGCFATAEYDECQLYFEVRCSLYRMLGGVRITVVTRRKSAMCIRRRAVSRIMIGQKKIRQGNSGSRTQRRDNSRFLC